MFGALIRAAERWPSIKITEFERRQLTAARKELDQEYETRIGLKRKTLKRYDLGKNFQHSSDLARGELLPDQHARKLAVIIGHLLACCRRSTPRSYGDLELRSGVPARRGQRGMAGAYNLSRTRKLERCRAHQAETAYRRMNRGLEPPRPSGAHERRKGRATMKTARPGSHLMPDSSSRSRAGIPRIAHATQKQLFSLIRGLCIVWAALLRVEAVMSGEVDRGAVVNDAASRLADDCLVFMRS
jgi:hypothetical protein